MKQFSGKEIAIVANFSYLKRKGRNKGSFSIDIAAEDIHIHDQFYDTSDGSGKNNDLCLLRTTDDIIATGYMDKECKQNQCVQVACLPAEPPRNGDACWIAGWGYTRLRDRLSNNLKQGGVNLLGKTYCTPHTRFVVKLS